MLQAEAPDIFFPVEKEKWQLFIWMLMSLNINQVCFLFFLIFVNEVWDSFTVNTWNKKYPCFPGQATLTDFDVLCVNNAVEQSLPQK